MRSHAQPRRGRPLLALLLGAAASVAGCRAGPPERVLDVEAHLTRQVADLRSLVERAERGALVPTDGLVVVVGEDAVQRLVQATLPREHALPGGFRVRLERVDVQLRDRAGAVQLEGRVGWAVAPDAFVDLVVLGRVDAVAVDPAEGTLTARMEPYGFEIRRRASGEPPLAVRLAEGLARALPQSLSVFGSALTIPVGFEHRLRFDGVAAGPVRLAPASLPLRVAVQDACAHGGRLWVSVRVERTPAGAGAR